TLDAAGALVAAAQDLPGVRGDRVALFGHSRGGGAALHYVRKRGGVRAAVLNSTGYPQFVVESAGEGSAPLLLLHGTEDGNPADGASDLPKVHLARAAASAPRQTARTA